MSSDVSLPGGTPPENYQRFFVPAIGEPVGIQLIRMTELCRGERVLDVGCGTGIVTRLAAEAVGEGTRVAGLDVNPGMLAVARSAGAYPGIEWYEADAAAMPLEDGAFDVVLCQMSLQFVPEPGAALREMRRVLARNGRLVLNVPGPAAPVFEILADALGRHIGPEAAGFLQTVFVLNDESELEDLVTDAGFRDVSASAHVQELSLPPPRDFLWQYIGSTPLMGAVSGAGDDACTHLEDELARRWQDFAHGGGMKCRQRIVTVSATT